MLAGVTVSCFLLSYLLVLLFEAARLVFKFPGRHLLVTGMLLLGLLAHSIFLFNQIIEPSGDQAAPQLLSNWFQWAVLGAWGLAVASLILMMRNPQGAFGLFLMPLVLTLIGLAQLLRDAPPFTPTTTVNLWRGIHGVGLLVSTMFIALGAAFGAMYLFQSYRLKARKQGRLRIKLPALEFLQSMNRLSIFASLGGLGVGLVSGIVLSFYREGQLAWWSGGIAFTFALFAWVSVAAILELASRGALGGRRSAYLVLANFLFLVLVLAVVMSGSHAQPTPTDEPVPAVETNR